jgi:hypothetical protein
MLPRRYGAEPPLAGHGGEGEGRCSPCHAVELLLAGRGGEEERPSCVFSLEEQRPRYLSLALSLTSSWASLLPPPCGRGDRQEGERPGVRRSGARRHTCERVVLTSSEAHYRRQISSGGVLRRRYHWPRGPLRTSEGTAPGSIYFLQAQVLKGKIFNLGVVIHPGGGPSGLVPGVAVSDHGPRFNHRCGGEEGPDCFVFYLSGFLSVISLDSCAIVTKAKVLFVNVPTV